MKRDGIQAVCMSAQRHEVFAPFFAALPRRGVPDPNRAIIAGGNEPMPVGCEGNRAHIIGMTTQGERFLSAGDVPSTHRTIGAAGGQSFPVWAEGHVFGSMTGQ